MPTTITGMLPELKNYTPTNLKLYRESNGEPVNGSGDAISNPSAGFYTASVGEAIVQYVAEIEDALGTIWTGWLTAEGRLQSDRPIDISDFVPNGNGARTVNIEVTDGSSSMNDAFVRCIKVGDSAVNVYALTVDGIATFNLDDGEYTVAITKTGYSFGGDTFIVAADSTEFEFEMTALAIIPGTGNFTTGYLTTYDAEGTIEAGVEIYSELFKAPIGENGFAYDSEIQTNISVANGLVQIIGLVKGAKYKIWRGIKPENFYSIPVNAGSTYALPSIIGREQE